MQVICSEIQRSSNQIFERHLDSLFNGNKTSYVKFCHSEIDSFGTKKKSIEYQFNLLGLRFLYNYNTSNYDSYISFRVNDLSDNSMFDFLFNSEENSDEIFEELLEESKYEHIKKEDVYEVLCSNPENYSGIIKQVFDVLVNSGLIEDSFFLKVFHESLQEFNKRAKIHFIPGYEYNHHMKEAVDIALSDVSTTGDLIAGGNTHIGVILKKDSGNIGVIRDFQVLNTDDYIDNDNVKYRKIPKEVSGEILFPHLFYSEVLSKCYIQKVELCYTHEDFISRYTKPDFGSFSYAIDSKNLYVYKLFGATIDDIIRNKSVPCEVISLIRVRDVKEINGQSKAIWNFSTR